MPSSMPGTTPRTTPRTTDDKRILLVDDEEYIIETLTDIFEEKGYRTTSAASGSAAIKEAEKGDFDAALIDIKLPDMEGIEVLKALKSISPELVCIIITGHASIHNAIEAMKEGAAGYFLKPIVVDEVVMRVEEALDKVRLQRNLMESEERYRSLVETSQGLIWKCDLDGRICYLNPAWERSHGYGIGEMLGMKFSDFQSERAAEKDALLFEELSSGGSVTGYETTHISKAGKNIELVCNATYLKDERGQIIGTQGTAFDITDLRIAEEVLSERTQLAELSAEVALALATDDPEDKVLGLCTELLVRHMDLALARIWTVDDKGKTLDLRSSAGMYTHTDGAHSRISVGEFKVGLIAKERRPIMTNSVVGDARIHDQEWARREGIVAFAGYPFIVKDRLLGVVAIFSKHQISEFAFMGLESIMSSLAMGIEHIRTDVALKESEERFRSLSEATFEGIGFSKKGVLFNSNTQLAEMLGYGTEELKGMEIVELIHPEDRELARSNIMRGSEEPYEMRALCKDGTVKFIEVHAQMMTVSGERVRVSAVRDITERKKAEEKLRMQDNVLSYMVAEGVFLVQVPDGTICYSNPTFERMFGYEPGELIGESVTVLNAPAEEGADDISVEVMQGLEKEGGWRGEVKNVKKDGTEFWCHVNVSTFEHSKFGLVALSVQTDISERKKSEEALEKSYRLLSNVIEGTDDLIFVKDLDGRYLMINTAVARVMGKTPEEMLGKDISDIYPAEKASEVMADDRKVMDLNESVTFEYRATVDGVERTYLAMKSPNRDPGGKVVGLIGIARDITERKRTEEAIRSVTERVSAVTGEPFFRQMVVSLAELLNTEIAVIGGLVGTDDIETVAVSMDGKVTGNFKYNLEGTPCFNVVNNVLCTYPSGVQELFPDDQMLVDLGIEGYMGAPLFDSAGVAMGVLVVLSRKKLENIEFAESMIKIFAVRVAAEIERMRDEEEIRESKQDWEDTFDTITDMITIHDADFNIVQSNKAAEEGLKIPALLLDRSKCYSYYHGTDGPPEGCPSCECLATHKPATFELFEPHLGKHLEIRAIPRLDDNNNFIGIVHIVRDLTERKESEAALRESEDKLRNAQKMEVVGNLAAGVAHEVRNPLAGIMANTQVLSTELGAEKEYKPLLFHISSQARRLSMLMNDLLDFGRTPDPSDSGPVDIVELWSVAVELFKEVPMNEPHDVRLVKPPRLGKVMVLGSVDSLEQAMLNLLDNAVQNDPGGGVVEVVVEGPAEGFCRTRVVDRGPGVPEEFVERVFEPFFTKRKKGTGLGLCIVKNTVESFGGTVSLSNNKDGPGCTVEVALPVREGVGR